MPLPPTPTTVVKSVPSPIVKPRRVRFEYPTDINAVWTPNRPEFSCAANAVSMLMPTIEPYFVRSARRAIPQLPADERAEAEAYVIQESQHFAQHVRFNRTLLAHYRALATIEGWAKSTYGWLEDRRSLSFSLAVAAASETMAYSAARWAADHRNELFSDPTVDETAATLFLWHLAEEVEHKSVAHDIYRTATREPTDKSLLSVRFLAATVVALALVVFFVFTAMAVMLFAERRLFHPLAWMRLTRWVVLFTFELLTNLTLSMLPGFHPTDFADPAFYEVWLQEFDSASATLPVWADVSD